ncbi:MAG: hypothetical protein EOM59_00450 [Clostridia bacterium]|nr:hypothetical protein [Clostridia bacterium]
MKWKTIVGIVLIAASLLILLFWELKGREILLLSPVLTAGVIIEAGTIVDENYFTQSKILPENVLSGAFSPQEIHQLNGLVANCKILANQQILPSYFQKESSLLKEGESLFVLPESWIYSMSSAIRAGDTIILYSIPENIILGQHIVAFVKDDKEQEVRDVSGQEKDFLKRAEATSASSHLEIICTLEEYMEICHIITEFGLKNLLVVLKG